jgi:hypothetical protein
VNPACLLHAHSALLVDTHLSYLLLIFFAGIYSGNFIIDPQGTWNGSSFTIIVNDTNPRFFHAITPLFSTDCPLLGNLSAIAQFPINIDEMFALNPVNPFLKRRNGPDIQRIFRCL